MLGLLATTVLAGPLALRGSDPPAQVELLPNQKRTVVVSRRGKAIWRGVPKAYRPWRLVAADVTGDGREEFVVAVNKKTRFKPWPHNTLFVYGVNGQGVHPLWLGSCLSRPFTDFAFARLTPENRARLVALETTLDGGRCVGVYRWNGFGFHKEREIGPWRVARFLSTEVNDVILLTDGKRKSVRQEMP